MAGKDVIFTSVSKSQFLLALNDLATSLQNKDGVWTLPATTIASPLNCRNKRVHTHGDQKLVPLKIPIGYPNLQLYWRLKLNIIGHKTNGTAAGWEPGRQSHLMLPTVSLTQSKADCRKIKWISNCQLTQLCSSTKWILPPASITTTEWEWEEVESFLLYGEVSDIWYWSETQTHTNWNYHLAVVCLHQPVKLHFHPCLSRLTYVVKTFK